MRIRLLEQSMPRQKRMQRVSNLYALASADSRSENVRITAVIVAELKFCNVQRQIFAADFVIAAHDAALNQRPETLNRVGVDRADNVLTGLVIDNSVIVAIAEAVVAGISVGAEQADAVGNSLVHKIVDNCSVNSENNASDNVALPLDRTDYWRAESVVAAPFRSAFLIPMAVFVFAADIGFIHFNDATEFVGILFNESGTHFVAHQPSGLVRTEPHEAHDLQCAHSFFAGQHQVNDPKPVAERLVRILEDCSGNVREAIGSLRRAVVALPAPCLALQFGNVSTAARAFDALGPATADQVGAASLFVGERALEIGGGELVDRLGSAGHRNIPLDRSILPCAA